MGADTGACLPQNDRSANDAVPSPVVSTDSHPALPEIGLAELPACAARLAERIRATGFEPELIIYVETGARLLAWEFCRLLGVPALPVVARRRGAVAKRLLAPIASRLPRGLRDALRRTEERGRWHAAGGRQVTWPEVPDLCGRRILLLDDAADTGLTVAAVKAAVEAVGGAPERLRVAVLAATTPEALRVVDAYLFDRNCRMPWSSDSRERKLARQLMGRCIPPHP